MRFPQQHPKFILWQELLLGQWSIRHDFTERDAVDVPNVEHVETQYAKYINCRAKTCVLALSSGAGSGE